MKITIAGAGAVGTYLAKMLSYEDHDITVIEKNKEHLQKIDSNFDVMTVEGSATSFEILKEANIKDCDLFIAVVDIEEINITAAILCKKLGAKKTIARIDNPEYLIQANKNHFKKLGIDHLIYPEKLAIKEVLNMLKRKDINEMMQFSEGELSMIAVKIEKNSPILEKTLIEIVKENINNKFTVVAIKRNSKTIIPKGEEKICINDLIYVVVHSSKLEIFMKYSLGKTGGYKKFKNIMILGGSRIGKRTAKKLEKQFNVKLIEINKEKSFLLADFLDNSLVINGDGSNIDLLLEEGIKNMDVFIAVTGNSEINILSSLLAKKFGVKKVIAEIENIDYIDLAENMNISSVINKKLIAASYIFRFTFGAKVSFLKCLTGTDAEVLEFVVQEQSKITKKKIKDLKFPKGAIIGGVVREKKGFIVNGDTKIKKNDKVVVFVMPNAIKELIKFFE